MLQTDFLFVGGSWDGKKHRWDVGEAPPTWVVPVLPERRLDYSAEPPAFTEFKIDYYVRMPWAANKTTMYIYALDSLTPEDVLWRLINGYKQGGKDG